MQGASVMSLSQNYCGDYPFKPLTAEDIYSELAESRDCYAKGEYEDFEDALDEVSFPKTRFCHSVQNRRKHGHHRWNVS